MSDSDPPPPTRRSRRLPKKVVAAPPDTQPQVIPQPLPSPSLEAQRVIQDGKLPGLSGHGSAEAFAMIAQKEARNSRRALRLSFIYAGLGVILLLVGLGAPFVPVSSFEEHLFANASLPMYLILRTLGFIGAISMAGWCLRMHNLAINRHWLHEEKEIEALCLLGDILSLSDHVRPQDVRDRLKDYRDAAARINIERMVESPEIGTGVVDKLVDLASGFMGRRKK